jgi:hypothetical protein
MFQINKGVEFNTFKPIKINIKNWFYSKEDETIFVIFYFWELRLPYITDTISLLGNSSERTPAA